MHFHTRIVYDSIYCTCLLLYMFRDVFLVQNIFFDTRQDMSAMELFFLYIRYDIL